MTVKQIVSRPLQSGGHKFLDNLQRDLEDTHQLLEAQRSGRGRFYESDNFNEKGWP